MAELTHLAQNTGYLIRPLRGHLPLKGKAFEARPYAFPFRGRLPFSRGDGRRPEGIGIGAERSEADEVRRGGTPGPPASP